MDQKSFFKLSYGLYLVTTSIDGKDSGCVVNTVTQVTAEPAKLSVAVSKNNYTCGQMQKAGCFSATVLTQQADMDLIGTFGFQSSRDHDKFAGLEVKRDAQGIPYVTRVAAAQFSCKIEQVLDLGTHILFIGAVEDAQVLAEDEVMTYSYYHQVKKGTTPKNAPSYQEESEKKGWRCTICGYVYEEDPLPEDFKCPVCGRGREYFERI